MDLRKLKTLIDLVSDSNVSELEITEAEGKVRIVKGGGAMVQGYSQPVYQQMQHAQPQGAPVAAAPVPAVVAVEEVPTGHTVKSPMVGTFYRSASPGAKAFVAKTTKKLYSKNAATVTIAKHSGYFGTDGTHWHGEPHDAR